MIVLGLFSWIIGLLALIAATAYVHYNSRKFGIGGGRSIITLLFAIVGLPLYAYDLHKLRKAQQTGQLRTVSEPVSSATPSMMEQTQTGQVPAIVPPTKFCSECGAKIPRDSMYCEVCGARLAERPVVSVPVPAIAPPLAPVARPKLRKAPIKTIVAALVFVILIVVAMVVPWIPVVRSKVVQQEFSYTYPVTNQRETQHQETVLSTERISLKAHRSGRQDYYWVSKGFRLEEGWSVRVGFWTDAPMWVSVWVSDIPSNLIGNVYYAETGLGIRGGRFIAPESKDYYVIFINDDYSSGHYASLELIAEWTDVQREEVLETKTITLDITRYNVTYVSLLDFLLHRV